MYTGIPHRSLTDYSHPLLFRVCYILPELRAVNCVVSSATLIQVQKEMKYSAFADLPSEQERAPLIKKELTSDAPEAGSPPIDQTDVEGKAGCFCAPEQEVCLPENFFDLKKGWLQHWNPYVNFNQLAIRTRYSGFFAFDAFRALAFLWVSNDHLISGLGQAFTGIGSWTNTSSAYRSFALLPYEGVTVFFCISGFLNLYVAIRLAKFFKHDHVSFKSTRNFLFRRFMHLAPNLWLAVVAHMIYGYFTTDPTMKRMFWSNCVTGWWQDLFFVDNFSDFFDVSSCYNSVWTISCEMQFYWLSVPIVFLYSYNKVGGALLVVSLIILVLWYRTNLLLSHPTMDGRSFEYSLMYSTPWGRGDAYLIGQLLYMSYENIITPIRKGVYLDPMIDDYAAVPQYDAAFEGPSPAPSATDESADTTSDASRSVVGVDGTESIKNNPASSIIIQNEESDLSGPSLWVFQAVLAVKAHFQEKWKQVRLFNHHAPLGLKFITYSAWTLSLLFIYLGLKDCFFKNNDFWLPFVQGKTNMNLIEASYGFFVIAGAACGLLFIAMEGSIVPVSWFFNQFFWYPVGNLTYTGYLLSILVCYSAGNIIRDRIYNGEVVDWNEEGYTFWNYFLIYWVVIIINLLLAFCWSMAIERPFMSLSKSIIW